MKCPHCNMSVSVFSKEMNQFGKSKRCPHCRRGVKLGVSPVSAAILFLPAVVLSLVLHRWLGSFSTGVSVVLLLLLSFRLKAEA